MAASTAASVIPRRRNCFSIISVRCGPYFSLSSMRNRRRVFFPGAGPENFLHLREMEFAFFLAIVAIRGLTHPPPCPFIPLHAPIHHSPSHTTTSAHPNG